ncbi:MAG: hypothetical protein ACLKAK_03220, partial [Alkaliphilus sp.]
MKGIIIDRAKFHTIILTPTGEYKKINRVFKNEIGEEFEFANRAVEFKHIIAIAAMFMLFIFSSLYYNMRFSNEVFAFVTMDINPSVEFEINKHNYVVNATAFNDDAEKILEDMNFRSKKIEKVTNEFTKKAVRYQFLDGLNDHIIFSVISNNGMGENDLDVIIDRIINLQENTLKEEDINSFIGVLQLTTESRKTAKEYGISATTLELGKKIAKSGTDGDVVENLEGLENISDEELDEIIGDINKRREKENNNVEDMEEIDDDETDDKIENEDEDEDEDEDEEKKDRVNRRKEKEELDIRRDREENDEKDDD